ncbi:AI-2E family transporter [Rheinheimera sp. WS51]|uniref:AI-2E family transporter n=1 Tax=Rheinheimera sp. WS51 TaxID=3425886 RepID=UPI003D8D668D
MTRTKPTAAQKRHSLHLASTAAMKILVVLAVAYTFYFCRSLLLPLMLSGLVALFSSPAVRVLTRIHIPKPLAAAAVLSILVFGVGFGISLLYQPASQWAERLPLLSHKLADHVGDMSDSINSIKEVVLPTQSDNPSPVTNAVGSGVIPLLSFIAQATAMALFQLAAVIMLTYFFLVFGDTLMRKLVQFKSSLHEKKNLVVMFQTIRDDISRYVLLVSVINVSLGLATTAVLHLLGVADPMLWGALAAILNFAPYIGPVILLVLLSAVGYTEYQQLSDILLVPGAFLVLNIIESQLITPLVLGRRFNMNPLLVVIWMFIWGWIWGAVGVLIAIPLLVSLKIITSHLDIDPKWLRLLET